VDREALFYEEMNLLVVKEPISDWTLLAGKREAPFRCINRSGYQLKLSHFLSTGWGPL